MFISNIPKGMLLNVCTNMCVCVGGGGRGVGGEMTSVNTEC